MTRPVKLRVIIAALLTVALIAGFIVVFTAGSVVSRLNLTAYFDNSNGLFVGDDVRILGVTVGKVGDIEAQPDRVKVDFWVDDEYKVPADAKAVILAPALVTARAIQLTPVYTSGAAMANDTVIPRERTAVPVEWDDVRSQLQRLAETLQPTQPGGVSTLGALVNTTADNLRGQGANIRNTLIKLSQAASALGDHSGDLFSTLRNLSLLVSALQDSSDVMSRLNQNLASVSGLLNDDPQQVGNAVRDLSDVASEVKTFVAQNRESIGVTSDKAASVTQALADSTDDVKQLLHISPTVLQNFINIYQPAQGTLTGALSTNNFSDPISFLCGAIQAASRMGAEQSAKLCVQYLAPIVKNRQYNFFPVGLNPFVGATARPNEVTYSEDSLRPDYVPPQPAATPDQPGAASSPDASGPASGGPPPGDPLPAEAKSTDPSAGLTGMMVPPGGGS